MHIEQLKTVNFKNLKDVNIQFSSKLNCLLGNNGAGKTNLLDAIYYLSFCKSFFHSVDLLNINHDESFFMINGDYFRHNTKEQISCALKKGQKKQFKRNGDIYKKLQDHIGLLPLVMISPSDLNLIVGGSDERRKFMDGVISQYNQNYLDDLIKYNRALQQRNDLLKQFAKQRYFDKELLLIWDEQLIEYGKRIHTLRKEFVEELIPIFQNYYQYISKNNEQVELIHRSDLYDEDFHKILNDAVTRDTAVQHTTVGIHRDDLILNLENNPIKKLGSQGQKKTYLVALKLAQFDFIKKISRNKPILLLDDIFDKLDKNRVEQIVEIVSGEQFGQIFITDTNREHLDKIIKTIDAHVQIFNVSNGNIKPVV